MQINGATTTGNKIQGNYIGTNAAGTGALANNDGVFITGTATGNFIGTDGNGVTDSGEGNVISGNASAGVLIISADGNRIAGNLIGLNAAGTAAVANPDGVAIFGATGNVIGTDGSNDAFNASERNYISGNSGRGVILSGANVVAGNWIGLKPDGTALGDQFGIQVTEVGGRVGTNADGIADADERNVISSNSIEGIIVRNAGTTGAVIAGNYIGTDPTGTLARPNGIGIEIVFEASGNTIGGTAAGAGNLISGNSLGMQIAGLGTTANTVAGNTIGLSVTGTLLPNTGTGGVSITDGATGNTIGGAIPSAMNVISGNSGDGVTVAGGPSGLSHAWYGDGTGTDSTGSLTATLNNAATFGAGRVAQGFQLNGASNSYVSFGVPALGTSKAAIKRNQDLPVVRRGLGIESANQLFGFFVVGTGVRLAPGSKAGLPERDPDDQEVLFHHLLVRAFGSPIQDGQVDVRGHREFFQCGDRVASISVHPCGGIVGRGAGRVVQADVDERVLGDVVQAPLGDQQHLFEHPLKVGLLRQFRADGSHHLADGFECDFALLQGDAGTRLRQFALLVRLNPRQIRDGPLVHGFPPLPDDADHAHH